MFAIKEYWVLARVEMNPPFRLTKSVVVAPRAVTLARVSVEVVVLVVVEVELELIVIVDPEVEIVVPPVPLIVISPVVLFRLETTVEVSIETVGFWPCETATPEPA